MLLIALVLAFFSILTKGELANSFKVDKFIAELIGKHNPDGEYRSVDGSSSISVNTRLSSTIFSQSNTSSIRVVSMKNILDSHLWNQNLTDQGLPACSKVHFSFQENFHQLTFRIKNCTGEVVERIQYKRAQDWSEMNYCKASNIFDGVWRTAAFHHENYTTRCPRLYNNIPDEKKQWTFYPALGPFKVSYFYTNSGCYTLPLKKSLEVFRHLKGREYPNWRFIGDSLVRQIDFTGRCELEHLFPRSFSYFNVSAENELPFFRADDQIHNITGKRTFTTPHHPYYHWRENKHIFSWLYHLHEDIDILVLDTGAWYSPYHLDTPESTANFTETIVRFLPHLETFMKKNSHVTVFWLGLPLMAEMIRDYAWDQFQIRNHLVRHLLEPFGVIYFDMERFGGERKKIGDLVSRDTLHWVSPGTFTIPSFAMERMIHLHVMRVLQNAHLSI